MMELVNYGMFFAGSKLEENEIFIFATNDVQNEKFEDLTKGIKETYGAIIIRILCGSGISKLTFSINWERKRCIKSYRGG